MPHYLLSFDKLNLVFRSVKLREDITRWCKDMNFIFKGQNIIFYKRAQRVSEILFLPRENKIHIFKPPCNLLFII